MEESWLIHFAPPLLEDKIRFTVYDMGNLEICKSLFHILIDHNSTCSQLKTLFVLVPSSTTPHHVHINK